MTGSSVVRKVRTMMTKDTFIKLMTEFLALEDDLRAVDKAMKKLSPDFGGFMLERHTTLFLKAMREAMEDFSDWIGYWMWELNKGADYKDGCVTDMDDNIIPLKTLSDLYDCIKGNDL